MGGLFSKINLYLSLLSKLGSPLQHNQHWDLGHRFRRVCKLAGINDLRIHDLRHFATTMLFIEGVADTIIRKMTGHRSEELERYKHLVVSHNLCWAVR